MAAELDRMLQPSERVLYRARGAWIPGAGVLVYGLFFALIAMFGAVAALVCAGSAGIWISVTAVATNSLVLSCAWYAFRWPKAAALVTDRRLLYRSSEPRAKVETMPLDGIQTIERSPSAPVGRLVVTGRAGQIMSFGPLHRAGRFATALAAAAGLTASEQCGGPRDIGALLQSGEKLLYRDPRRRLPRPPLPEIVLMVSVFAMGWLLMESKMVWLALGPAFLGVIGLIHYLVEVRKLYATTVAVSDRRVIYRSGGPGPEFKDITLTGIEAVHCETAGLGGTATVTDRHGRNIPLRHMGDPRALVERIAAVSGAQRPSFDSLLAWRGVLALGPTALLFMIAFRYLSEAALGTSWLPLEEASAGAEDAILNFLSFILALPAGLYLGTLVAMASLRPRVTGGEMHAALIALQRRSMSNDGCFKWWLAALQMWEPLLYGRPPAPADEGAKGHG